MQSAESSTLLADWGGDKYGIMRTPPDEVRWNHLGYVIKVFTTSSDAYSSIHMTSETTVTILLPQSMTKKAFKYITGE